MYTQVELRLEGSGVLVIPQGQLREIPYLKALTSTRWSPVQKPYTLIQAKEWNNDLTLLSDLLRFLREDKESYRLPQDWKRTFSLIRLADMLCVDTFIHTVARATRIPVPLLDNSNPIKSVRLRLRAAYRLAKYLKDKVHTGICGVCSLPLGDIPPYRAEVVYMPCCSCTVPARCWKDPMICSACSTGLLPLPCVICKAPIECWGGDTRDIYIFSKETRLGCCNADAHYLCRAQFLSRRQPKCPACQCYLSPSNTLHCDWCEAADHIFARREQRKNSIRRRLGKDYSYMPF